MEDSQDNNEEVFEFNLDLSDPKEFVPAPMMNYFGSIKENLAQGRVLSIAHALMDEPFEVQALNDTLGVLYDLGADKLARIPNKLAKTDDAEPRPTISGYWAQDIQESLMKEIPMVLGRLAEIIQAEGIPDELVEMTYLQDMVWCSGLFAWLQVALARIEESGFPDLLDNGFLVGFADLDQLTHLSAITERRLIAAAHGHP